MNSFHILVFLLGVGTLPLAQSRPKERSHRGLYDEWKTVPYVDEHGDVSSSGRSNGKGNSFNDRQLDTQTPSDKDGQSFESFSKETIEADGKTSLVPDTTSVTDISDIVPIEGGTEDMAGVSETDQLQNTGHHHQRNRGSSHHRHKGRESRIRQERVIDHGGLSLNADEKKESPAEETKSWKIYRDDVELHEFDLAKFYAENPNFQRNVGTIVDESVEESDTSNSDEESNTESTDSETSLEEETVDEDDSDSISDDGSEVNSDDDSDWDPDSPDSNESDDHLDAESSEETQDEDDVFDWDRYDRMYGDDAAAYHLNKKNKPYTLSGSSSDKKNKPYTMASGSDTKDKPYTMASESDNKKDKPYTMASGSDNKQDKPYTMASGSNNKQDKPYTMASGSDNKKDKPYTMASGSDNKKDKPYTMASGSDNKKDKPYTMASGSDNKQDKPYTMASGSDNKQDKPYTMASGSDNKKDKPYTMASGSEDKKNKPYTMASEGDDKKNKPYTMASEGDDKKNKPYTMTSGEDGDKKMRPYTLTDPASVDDKKEKPYTFYKSKDKMLRSVVNHKKYPDVVPKTDVEPSTSPNPPTEKKKWESTVTQPVYPNGNEKHEAYIESKPIEACDTYNDCPPGRMCKFGLCICGQEGFCDGHKKEVCGSDGVIYPSHCELHRTACVNQVHIRLDFNGCRKPADLEDSSESDSDDVNDKPLAVDNIADGKPVVAPVVEEEEMSDGKDDSKEPEQNEDQLQDDKATKPETESVQKTEQVEEQMQGDAPAEDTMGLSKGKSLQLKEDKDDSNLLPLSCTPELYLEFKAKVLLYHCIFFEEKNCDAPSQEDNQHLASIIFNYFDDDKNGILEMEELWEMQLRENMDKISSLCTLLDLVELDELGTRDWKLSPEEFLQAFDIPDVLEHHHELVTMTASVGNALEVRCGVASSSDVIWKRNDMDLALLDYPGISVLDDGSLYLEKVSTQHIGNLTCYERSRPSVKQTNTLLVTKPPVVLVSPANSHHINGADVVIRCHAEGLPRPNIEWRVNGFPLEQSQKYHVQTYDQTLTVYAAMVEDSGKYTCVARNDAGEAQASCNVEIHEENDTKEHSYVQSSDSFIVFHDDGYTMHEPSDCLTQRQVQPDFGNFHFIPDELDQPPRMCQSGLPCVWGGAVNVKNMYVYATQPRENRLLVIDLKNTLNPSQVIDTDRIPVSVQYIEHLDEVWVLCWNGEEDYGSKTIIVIRDASQNMQHRAVHTQPIGNRFDLVQDVFLPPNGELHEAYQFGYTVHNGQQGLFKVDLAQKRYIKAVDFSMFACIPKTLTFIPLGGHVMVKCLQRSAKGENNLILRMDYVTDIVVENKTMPGTPYVTPDSRHMVIVDEDSGHVTVYSVSEKGEITKMFDTTTGSPVSDVAFHRAGTHQGYDLFLTSDEGPVIFSVSLLNGGVDAIKDMDDPGTSFDVPWLKKSRPLTSGDVFSDYLATTSMSSMVIVNGKHHNIRCDFTDLENPTVTVFCQL